MTVGEQWRQWAAGPPQLYRVFDYETTTAASFKRKANPFDPKNWVVLEAYKTLGDSSASWRFFDGPAQGQDDSPRLSSIPDDVQVLVGFNMKFDLHYLLCSGDQSFYAFIARGGVIWDCQYVEYLLQGQVPSSHLLSLDEVAPRYGGSVKLDQVKAMWEAGIDTPDIPRNILLDYAVGTEEEGRNGGDIGNTEKVFLGQWEAVRVAGMLPSVLARMLGLAATTEMEYRGLYVDMQAAKEDKALLDEKLAKCEAELQRHLPDMPAELPFNWGSKHHVSALIFGGALKYRKKCQYTDEGGQLVRYKATADWPLFAGVPRDPSTCTVQYGLYVHPEYGTQDVYLSGQKKGQGKARKVDVLGEPKEKFFEFSHTLPRMVEPLPAWKTANTGANGDPVYQTGSDVLDYLRVNTDVPFIALYAEYQALQKEIGTYYFKSVGTETKGMLTCVDPRTRLIHHKLNHTSTVTTRLSSSDPNAQNIPRGDKSRVKRMFRSRRANGAMLEADYMQLEVVIQGVLSGDKNLCEDLRQKIDFHCKRVALQYGVTYEEALKLCKDETGPDYAMWKKRRTGCKNFSFQRAYGAGAAAISAATGIPVAEVEKMIENEEAAYPGLLSFNTAVATEVADTAKPFYDVTVGKVFRRGTYRSSLATVYSFRSYEAPKFMQDRGQMDSFSPPELKNYPVQGTGGQLVQTVAGMIFRDLCQNDFYGGSVLLVNTVHDCYWFDLDKASVQDYAAKLRGIMESIPDILADIYEVHTDVPFPCEIEVGENMLELHHLNH